MAAKIRADRDYPSYQRATMDGYALRYGDLEKNIRRFTIAETLFAGDTATRTISEGECYKIMTGAAVPGSADLVIRREDVKESPATMVLRDEVEEGWRLFQNIARRGEDLQAGAGVIHRNCRCEPAVMGLLATLGKTTGKWEKLPRISLMTTGNEVVPVGNPVKPVPIRNSNRWLLEGAFKKERFYLGSFA